jgi:hypothetical protein
VVGLIAAVYGGAMGFAVNSARSDLVRIEPGTMVTIVGAVILAGGSIAAIVVGSIPLAPAAEHIP